MSEFSKGEHAQMRVATASGPQWINVTIVRSYAGQHGGRKYDVISDDMTARAAFNVSPLSLRPINSHVAPAIRDALNPFGVVRP